MEVVTLISYPSVVSASMERTCIQRYWRRYCLEELEVMLASGVVKFVLDFNFIPCKIINNSNFIKVLAFRLVIYLQTLYSNCSSFL
jgi:hypothetical protein